LSSELETVLAPLVSALEADGYNALIGQHDGVVSFEIQAGPQACQECLSPRQIMEPMIQHVLRQGGYDVRLDLRYPAGHHDSE
jgi:hypothetical protein